MFIYLLLTVQCTISEPSKNFTLKCKPEVTMTYQSREACEKDMTAQSACLAVKVGKS